MAPPGSGRKRPATVKVETGASPRPAKKAAKTRATPPSANIKELKERFLAMFEEPTYTAGISNTALKNRFSQNEYIQLAPIINSLLTESRLHMSRGGGREGELIYSLISDEQASKFSGLDVSARMVYQVIEKAGNMGIWTKDIKKETNIQNQALNKIFKSLESRRLIKPVKSITAKQKKLYMLYELTPSTELTGGIWYSDLEFDHGFITELSVFTMHCVRKLNGGQGVTLSEILEKMNQAKVSRVNLGLNDMKQLMQTLVYDYAVDEVEKMKEDGTEETYYVASRRVSTMCEFKMWSDVLAPDFHFRTIQFEDGVTLKPHELHYHS